jgi:uncharacterized protein YecA (UPF0149 family)
MTRLEEAVWQLMFQTGAQEEVKGEVKDKTYDKKTIPTSTEFTNHWCFK